MKKIIFILLCNILFILSIYAQTTYNVTTIYPSATTIPSAGQTTSGLTIIPGGANTISVKVASNGKSTSDGKYSGLKSYIKLGGAGLPAARTPHLPTQLYVSIPVTGSSKITAYGMSETAGQAETLIISDGTNRLGSYTTSESNATEYPVTANYTGGAGTIYLYADNTTYKGFYIFLIVVEPLVLPNPGNSLDFESATVGSTGGCTALWTGGSIDVKANPYSTGINTSSKCLHVLDNNYLPIYFNLALPAGNISSYPFTKVKYKLCYIGDNGGTDQNYPNVDFYSALADTVSYPATSCFFAEAGWNGSTGSVCWGDATSSLIKNTWAQFEFAFSSSTKLTTIPAGFLMIKIAKQKAEYLIDDIELIAAPTPALLINSFDTDANGTSYVTTGATGATATVEADPVNTGKSLHILTDGTNYDQFVNINVTLPIGKVMSDCDKILLDRYIIASSTVYKNFFIKVGTTTIYADAGYPSQGTNNVWQNKEYDLTGVDLSAVGNSFTLTMGISGPALSYYLDNIKLHLKDIGTGNNQISVNPLIIYCTGNAIQINKQVSEVQLFDINGRLLISKKNTSSLDVNNLAKGIYLVKSYFEGNSYSSKIAK